MFPITKTTSLRVVRVTVTTLIQADYWAQVKVEIDSLNRRLATKLCDRRFVLVNNKLITNHKYPITPLL